MIATARPRPLTGTYNEWRRWRGCESKVQYLSEKAAIRALRRAIATGWRPSHPLAAYPCGDHWHVGGQR